MTVCADSTACCRAGTLTATSQLAGDTPSLTIRLPFVKLAAGFGGSMSVVIAPGADIAVFAWILQCLGQA